MMMMMMMMKTTLFFERLTQDPRPTSSSPGLFTKIIAPRGHMQTTCVQINPVVVALRRRLRAALSHHKQAKKKQASCVLCGAVRCYPLLPLQPFLPTITFSLSND
jgi:hypothetical protein